VIAAARRVSHLVSRFLGQLDPRPPRAADEAWADALLSQAERALWVRLGNGDRRHAIGVAQRMLDLRPDASRAEMAAALLHDIGKVDGPRNAIVRAWFAVSPVKGARVTRYRDHERIGAELLREAGSDPITVDLVGGQGPLESRRALDRADDAGGLRDRG